ncbi:MAG: hypothetical protein K2X73_12930 [Sphingomonas sp.]|uniref:DUF6626 family protein n=1 Tax=Sphingomonas sp. TaxID=28214 RepID=UPI0025DFCCC4|nr:DUF6626 family protein [Sphingomonas sp.]MBX9882867.1 hypothetical protein [Sphingomonas sp.]
MILDDVFQFLKAEGLTRTHATFSTDYLGHSSRYYDYLRCSGASPSLRSLFKLALCLSKIVGAAASCSGHDPVATDLAKRIMAETLVRCE